MSQEYTTRHKFCICITCYKDTSVLTLQTLKAMGYTRTDNVFIMVGTDDPKVDEFKEKYGDMVYVFDKDEIAKEFNIDDMNCTADRTKKVILYARFACYKCAKEHGYPFFQQLDDDYAGWSMRIPVGNQLKTYVFREDFCKVDHLYEKTIDLMIDLLETNPHMTCVALAQAGDFIGGSGDWWRKQGKRKVMNTMVFNMATHIPRYRGNLNEDVNLYLDDGRRGNICITYAGIMISQATTQKREVGGVEAYTEYGTYFKSFFSVMANPSCCKISVLNSNTSTTYHRIHHKIDWDLCCPKIISENYKIK